MVKENIFTFPVSTGSYQQFIDEIFKLSEHKASSYVCFANVHMVIEAYNNPSFSTAISNADIVTPDGKPVALFLKFLKKINQERVAGLDVFPDLLREAEARKKSIYFYGTTEDILDKIEQKAKREYPDLNISGLYSPPFRSLSPDEETEVITRINDAKPDLIFVALGCPKQERWMAEHKSKINGCMLGIGHAFKVYAEVSKRSPKWMQKLSLEWAYRLYQEPGRLWKRYFYTNSLFLFLTFKYFLSTLFGGKKRAVSNVVYKCEYNIILVPAYRLGVLSEDITATLDREIHSFCEQVGCGVKNLSILSDRVLLRVSVPPKISLASVMEPLKSKSSSNLIKLHPTLKGNAGNSFWTNGYFVSTDMLTEDVIKRYIKYQENERL